jgi:hypothetical protein
MLTNVYNRVNRYQLREEYIAVVRQIKKVTKDNNKKLLYFCLSVRVTPLNFC